jgi:hypothetical protein
MTMMERSCSQFRNEGHGGGGIQDLPYQIGNDPLLFGRRIDMINRLGVVGERRSIALYLTTLDSRLLLPEHGSSDVIAVREIGSSGAGKSYTLHKCLHIYDPNGFQLITAGSNKSLFYLPEDGLQHRCLILEEGSPIEKNGKDSEFIYALRTLISEGHLKYSTVMGCQLVERCVEGPTSFITTSTVENIETQIERRMFITRPDESREQTEAVLQQTALNAMGFRTGIRDEIITAYRQFHSLLQPVDVIIPYAMDISRYLEQRENLNTRYRRSFRRFLSVIKAISAAHQFRILHSETRKAIAGFEHYHMALQVARDAFRESVGEESRLTIERLAYIDKYGPILLKDLCRHENVSKQEISAWNQVQEEKGNTMWCNEKGAVFATAAELKRAKHSGKAFIKAGPEYVSDFSRILPTTYELSQRPEWKDGGSLSRLYDLRLDERIARNEAA